MPDLEAVWIESKLNQESILMGSFYRPHNSLVNYWNLISESTRNADSTMLKYFIFGDFNCDFLHSPDKYFLDILDRYNLYQLVNEHTRITETSSTCIDLITSITQYRDLVKTVKVLPQICSDHSVPCVTIKNTARLNTSFKRRIYNHNEINVEQHRELLENVPSEQITESESVDQITELFTEAIISAATSSTPSKIITVKSNDAVWMNDYIRFLISKTKQLSKKS